MNGGVCKDIAVDDSIVHYRTREICVEAGKILYKDMELQLLAAGYRITDVNLFCGYVENTAKRERGS